MIPGRPLRAEERVAGDELDLRLIVESIRLSEEDHGVGSLPLGIGKRPQVVAPFHERPRWIDRVDRPAELVVDVEHIESEGGPSFQRRSKRLVVGCVKRKVVDPLGETEVAGDGSSDRR